MQLYPVACNVLHYYRRHGHIVDIAFAPQCMVVCGGALLHANTVFPVGTSHTISCRRQSVVLCAIMGIGNDNGPQPFGGAWSQVSVTQRVREAPVTVYLDIQYATRVCSVAQGQHWWAWCFNNVTITRCKSYHESRQPCLAATAAPPSQQK